jgi:hypothetical protein
MLIYCHAFVLKQPQFMSFPYRIVSGPCKTIDKCIKRIVFMDFIHRPVSHIRQVLEKNGSLMTVHQLFIDFKKAFNSVKRVL